MMRKIIETKYTVYNKLVAIKYGIYASILLGELISLHDYHEQKGTLSASGDFYVSTNYIKEGVGLSRYNQQIAINSLESAGLISVRIENNNLRYFHLNEDKICEITGFEGGAKNGHPLSEINTPCQNLAGGCQNLAGGCQKLAPINKEYKIKNKNNNIVGEKIFSSNADASPIPTSYDVETELVNDVQEAKVKAPRKTKKQQRYDEVLTSTEFNEELLEGIDGEQDKKDISTLWGEYVELRCSKDYKAFTDGAVKRNLKVLAGTSSEERKAILEKSVTKGWTGLFPLNDYDKQRLAQKEANVEGSDEWLYNKIFKTKCREKEDELPEGTTHNLLMELCDKYGEEKIKDIYYNRIKPEIQRIYGIKRDWKA